jgi:hypothetical protein
LNTAPTPQPSSSASPLSAPPPSRVTLTVYFFAALGAVLIVAGLAALLYYRTLPPPLNQARIEERIKFRQEINAAGADALDNFGWQDQSKGLVRLPITNAMELLVREWKNPAAGRSNLLARLDKANPPPPPPKPTQFE